jgi:chemotaxis regulatin CheY-phosphate phosphatase CheZ
MDANLRQLSAAYRQISRQLETQKSAQELKTQNQLRFLNRFLDSSLRTLGLAFRQASQFAKFTKKQAEIRDHKVRSACQRFSDRNTRLLSQGWNKLITSDKISKSHETQTSKKKHQFLKKIPATTSTLQSSTITTLKHF